jgi:hypothetical protein
MRSRAPRPFTFDQLAVDTVRIPVPGTRRTRRVGVGIEHTVDVVDDGLMPPLGIADHMGAAEHPPHSHRSSIRRCRGAIRACPSLRRHVDGTAHGSGRAPTKRSSPG